MKAWLHFADWPLQWKMAALLLAASLLPLGLSMWVDARHARELLLDGLVHLIEARSDQVADELDAYNRSVQISARGLALAPPVLRYCAAADRGAGTGRPARVADESAVRELLATVSASDADLRGAAIVDAGGRVLLAHPSGAEGRVLANRSVPGAALERSSGIAGVFLGLPGIDDQPMLAFFAPVRGGCLAVLWVDPGALWQRIRASDALAGPGSFAVVYDREGIRIAHTSVADLVFHPAGPLAPAIVDALAAERRFGSRTRELLTDVRPFPEQFERARADRLDRDVFRGRSPVNSQLNYGVGRRLESVGWTVFYMLPAAAFEAPLLRFTRERALFGAAIMVLAIVAGFVVARDILSPASALLAAARAIAAGDLAARVRPRRGDELGQLGHAFDAMAERVQAQDADLRDSRDRLDHLVRERTAELSAEVAERSRAEASARESRELLQAVIDNSGALIYAKDADGRFVLVNRQLAATFRRPPDAFLGHTDHDFFPAEAADAYRAMDLRVIASGQALIEEERVPTDEGMRTYVSVKCPLRDAADRIRGIVGISTDITDRKRAEARLRDQLERMQLLDQLTAAIAERQDLPSIYQVLALRLETQLPAEFACVCRPGPQSGRLTVMGAGRARAPLDLAGADDARAGAAADHGSDVRGTAPGTGVGPPSLPADCDLVRRALAGELACEHDIAALPGPLAQQLGAHGLRSLVVAPLQNQGEVFGLLLVACHAPGAFSSGACEFLRQLSTHVALAARQAQLHGALQRAYDDLRQTQQAVMQQERLRALGQMASGIAHDINNAISPVALYTEALLEREPALSERGRGYLQTIARAIEDVAETVARMREFYREREPQLELRPVRLDEIARQVIELTRVRWSDMPQQRGAVIDLVTDFAPGLPGVLGIESELREALTNLVFNAVDAMPAGGRLLLRTRRLDGEPARAALEVVDTGVGMDEDTRRRCLEPFFTTKGERGTGLGLAMVYGVAQRHDAGIEIDSAPGAGTTLRLVFPVPAARPAEAAAPPAEARPARRLRLLVVDDDPLMLASVRDALELDGHEVVTAAGGQAGIELLGAAAGQPATAGPGEALAHAARPGAGGAAPFDALITDLGMPHVDGRRVAAAARERWPALPVILLTGWGQRMAADGEHPPNVDRVLAKPPRLRELRATLAELVDAAAPSGAAGSPSSAVSGDPS
ncbi:PAS domain-containing protein [Derxia gummosa]|uniref:histidine kinase n=1 Tax=Derxia gummosa DSM 723 TaxID=1121388 RepID=A0A8B6XAW9_9BURK|nr:PAS domain-containing protein [Derxia gummosa]